VVGEPLRAIIFGFSAGGASVCSTNSTGGGTRQHPQTRRWDASSPLDPLAKTAGHLSSSDPPAYLSATSAIAVAGLVVGVQYGHIIFFT
jgi:hypothetical protein